MDRQTDRYPGVLLAFWIAAALTAAGGVAPLFFGGTSNRMALTIIPFAIAATAMALNALLHHQGRTIPTLLYFAAGLAIVYAILAMIVVPLQLAVLGTCPPAPDSCLPGQQSALSGGETDGLAAGVTLGLLAIGSGFVGLAMLYRRKPKLKLTATAPAVRSRPAMESKAAISEPEAAPAEAAPAEAAPLAAAVHEAPAEPQAPAEPEAPAEPKVSAEAVAEEPAPLPELPAPEPVPELAAHEPEAEIPAAMAPAPPPVRQPRTKRSRKSHPESPAEPGSESPADEPPSN